MIFEDRKIAPQNIMYDRRVVRGNTFAALVIPVSTFPKLSLFNLKIDMQPDPALIEKQKQEQMIKKQRLEHMHVRAVFNLLETERRRNKKKGSH